MRYLTQIANETNLSQAFRHIAANKGGPGVDGITVEAFQDSLEHRLADISRQLLQMSYRFQPVLSVTLASQREVFLLTVSDRVVAQAMHQVLWGALQKYLHPSSYAYCPGRSAVQATQELQKELMKREFPFVLRCDVHHFFDEVDHQVLANFLTWSLGEEGKETIRTIMAMARQPRMVNGQLHDPKLGLCQGSPLSPLLSNLYLTPLDRYLEKSGRLHFRFSDDLAVLLKDSREAGATCEEIGSFLKAHLRLRLNPKKVFLNSFDGGFEFLGFHFSPKGRFPGKEAEKKISDRVALSPDEGERQKAVQRWEAYYGKGSYENLQQGAPRDSGGNGDSFPIVSAMMQCFRGNPSCFAKAYKTAERYGYVPVEKPIQKEDLIAHLLGKETLGIYPLQDDRVACTCLDLDIEKNIMDTAYHNDAGQFSVYADRVLQEARRVEKTLLSLGFDPLLEESGYKGYHVWVLLEDFAPAGLVIRLWQKILQASPAPKGILREVFPRESRTNGKRGSLIKLPLSIHPLSGKRSMFLDGTGEMISNPQALLLSIRKAPIALLERATEEEKPVPASEIDQLIARCNVVRALCDKARDTHHLGHFERVVLLYTLGQMGKEGEERLHRTVRFCHNYNFHFTQRQIEKKHPSPMGCRRIQEIMGDSLSDIECRCVFDVPPKGYASPILHVYPQATKNLARPISR